MKYFGFTGDLLKDYNTTLKYLSSEVGINHGNKVQAYYLKYIGPYIGKTGPKPENNPVESLEYILNKKPKDIYQTVGKLSRKFII